MVRLIQVSYEQSYAGENRHNLLFADIPTRGCPVGRSRITAYECMQGPWHVLDVYKSEQSTETSGLE